jgi:ABC-type uncharacterized transport system involved in gliding motility auxiliary subunit
VKPALEPQGPAERTPAPRRRGLVWLVAVLLVAVYWESARLVERGLRLRVDLSEDRLLSVSPESAAVLRGLEDLAQLELYFTAGSRSAAFQLTQARLTEQLREFERLSRGRLELVFSDPGRSAAAALEAERYGLSPRRIGSVGGSQLAVELVHLGAVLRYRGAEQVLPWLTPASLEYQLVAAALRLERARPVRLGWYVGGPEPERFRTAREVLATRAEIVPLGGLEEGRALVDLDLAVLVQPVDLAPRAVYELDQFLQRGGRLALVLDRSYGGLEAIRARRLEPLVTGLEAWLATLGLECSPDLLWDQVRHRPVPLVRAGADGARGTAAEQWVPFPLWPDIGPDGFAEGHPLTHRLPSLPLRWAHPLRWLTEVEGLERQDLVRTSERTYRVPFAPAIEFDLEAIRLRESELLASGDGARETVVAALQGRFPSPFAERGPPPVRDPFGGPDRSAPGDGPVLSAAADTRLLVVGDTDWLSSSGGRMAPECVLFLENLVDWLGVAPELLALRNKLPRDRSIRDFEREEFERAGLSTLGGEDTAAGRAARGLAEQRALERAQALRRRYTAAAPLGTLLALGAVVCCTRVLRRWRLARALREVTA